MSIQTLVFTAGDKCIGIEDTMIPGYGYTDADYTEEMDLPPGFNPLDRPRSEIEEVIKSYKDTGQVPEWAMRRKKLKLRPAEAADEFGKGQPVERMQFEDMEEDPDDDNVVDLTDRAPRRPMPKAPETTVAEHILLAAQQLLDIRNQVLVLAQLAESGTDIDNPAARELFEEIETTAKQIAVRIERPDFEAGA